MSKQANLIPYDQYSPRDTQHTRETMGRAKGTGEFYKLIPGKHTLRILPARKGQKTFCVSAMHYITIPGREKKLVFPCPRIHAKESCPACAEYDRLRSSKDPRERGRASEYKPSVSIYCNVIDRKEVDGDPKSMRLPQSVHDELVEYIEDPDEPIDFLHPLEGYDVIILRKGSTLENTRYSMRLAARPSPIAEEIEDINMLLSSQPDLEKRNELRAPEELVKLMQGEPRSTRQLGTGRTKPRHQRSKNETPVVDGELDEDDDFPET